MDYHLGDIFADLLIFAASSLVDGGRLVFWIPVNREHYSEEKLPSHPRLKLVANCEQWLSSHTSRRCLVLEKVIINVKEEWYEQDPACLNPFVLDKAQTKVLSSTLIVPI